MGLKKEEIPIVPSFINVYKAMEQLLLSVTPTEDAHTHTHTHTHCPVHVGSLPLHTALRQH